MKIRGTTITTPLARHAVPDDAVVSKKPWSSMNTVDKLCPSFTEQGAVVTISDPLEGYPLQVVSTINASQSGSGDPSPDNVRPIIGWDAMTVSHTGKNFFDFKGELVLMDGRVDGSGDSSNPNKYRGFVLHLPVGTYTIRATEVYQSDTPQYIYGTINNNGKYVKDLVFVQNKIKTPVTFNISEGDVLYVYNSLKNLAENTARVAFDRYNLMLVSGNTKADYEPFCGSIVTIHFNQTVYGGTYDSQSGLLTIEYGINKVKDFTDWEMNTNGTFSTMSLVGKAVYVTNGKPPIGLCSHYKGVSLNDLGNHDDAYTLGRNGTAECRIKDTSFTTVESFLAEMGECQILYQLVKPRTVQLTPQEFIALSSENFLGCNTGDITITGKADPAATIKKLTERIAALEATAVNNI